jgi:hypothetical protein
MCTPNIVILCNLLFFSRSESREIGHRRRDGEVRRAWRSTEQSLSRPLNHAGGGRPASPVLLACYPGMGSSRDRARVQACCVHGHGTSVLFAACRSDGDDADAVQNKK